MAASGQGYSWDWRKNQPLRTIPSYGMMMSVSVEDTIWQEEAAEEKAKAGPFIFSAFICHYTFPVDPIAGCGIRAPAVKGA